MAHLSRELLHAEVHGGALGLGSAALPHERLGGDGVHRSVKRGREREKERERERKERKRGGSLWRKVTVKRKEERRSQRIAAFSRHIRRPLPLPLQRERDKRRERAEKEGEGGRPTEGVSWAVAFGAVRVRHQAHGRGRRHHTSRMSSVRCTHVHIPDYIRKVYADAGGGGRLTASRRCIAWGGINSASQAGAVDAVRFAALERAKRRQRGSRWKHPRKFEFAGRALPLSRHTTLCPLLLSLPLPLSAASLPLSLSLRLLPLPPVLCALRPQDDTARPRPSLSAAPRFFLCFPLLSSAWRLL